MLKIENASFGFGNKNIFSDLNISFERKPIYGIVGKNGVGKTTLFRNISGIYKIQKGNIMLNGEQVKNTMVSMLPTEPYFYPYITGGEYIELINGSIDSKTKKYAALLNVPLNELIDTFSTGMKKKIAFLGIISQDRPILILDEPFNGVDLESNEIIKSIIRHEKKDRILLVSSHILSTMTDLCDTILYISDGFNCQHFDKKDFINLEKLIAKEIQEKINGI